MEFSQLNYFRTVARTGNISQAARELFVTQPNLSRSIARLEGELGVPLFEHRKGKVVLNEYGRIFLSGVENAFGELNTCIQTVQRLYENNQNILSLGCSIDGFLPDILQPFSRALDERSGGVRGAGLGLAIARDIVRMMDGDIRVQSQVGKGSRFTVDLRMEIQRGQGDLHGQRALLVGLDAAQRQSLSEMLMQMGVAPQSVEGQEAVRAIDQTRERQSPYLAVILDGEGVESLRMARKIRGRGAQPPLILLAGRAHAASREEMELADVQVIQKPVFRSRLEQALIDLSGRGEARAQSAREKFRGRRVLLVEDNALNMEVAENLLRLSGLTVDRAFSGEEAVSMLERAAPGRYDLVFMDIRMPRMDGYQAAAAIRALGRSDLKSLPIIAMSASVMAKDVSKARSAGMNDHISKPVEMAILTGVLEKWLGKR